ncbi:kelch domain-containing protein 10 homolog isoform X2 [Microplitis mediator]|uniref:kelch domain-containing protein 10 homolog isoform X2 n=1 Tax=Microplitis mediator TaxID=375433 RepID=UPI00255764EC|nr:kelch domain-containing protein 10 homolog isoform X2 [Microplitis mediator]
MKVYKFKPYAFKKLDSKSSKKPKGRSDADTHCDGKNLYIYQGWADGPDPESNDIWVYNLAGKQWRLIRNESNLPHSHYDSIFGTIFESNYLINCTLRKPIYDELSVRKCRIHICNLNTESVLVRETSGQIPYPSFPHNLIRQGKYFYSVGITRNHEYFSDVYKLNIENGLWEVVYICQGLDANEPVGRIGHTLVYDNNMIYIFSAILDDSKPDAFSFATISAFDLEKCCWKKIETYGDENQTPHYPTKREDFAVTSHTDQDLGEINVIISGGIIGSRKHLNDVWRLNLTSLKWTCLKKFGTVLPRQVFCNSMTVSPDGKLFTFGGFVSNKNVDTIRISTAHSTWLRIPKLTEICWEAVFHYYRNLTSMSDKEIISLGIPLHLLKSRIN